MVCGSGSHQHYPSPQLLEILTNKWRETSSPPVPSRTTRVGHEVSTDTRVETWEAIYTFLSHFIQRGTLGVQTLTFLGVKVCGTVELLHSLFMLPLGPYDENYPVICTIEGRILENGLPSFRILPKMVFAKNDNFWRGGGDDEFEAHMTGLSSTLLRNLDSNAFQELSEEEDGAREIGLCRLTFVAGEAISTVVELGPSPSITAVAYKLAPFLLRVNHPTEKCAWTSYRPGSPAMRTVRS